MPKSARTTSKKKPKVLSGKVSDTKKKSKIPHVLDAELLEESKHRPLDEEQEDSGHEPGEPEELDGTDHQLGALVLPAQKTEEHTAVAPQLDLLKRYIADASKYPLLEPSEELELVLKLRQSGDLEAARRLARANLRLVIKIAMEYRNAYQNVMDLIQEGNMGLLKAITKYDPTKGARLSYYAGWWIRSYILKYILDNFRLVKIGTTQAQKKLFFHLIREKERLEAQGLHPGPKLLADKLHVREKDVIEMDQRLGQPGAEMSLNTPVGHSGDDENKVNHLDMLIDSSEHADNVLAEEELKDILREHLVDFEKTLKDKEVAIFRGRLATEEPKTLQEVADQFGLTRERARQIEVQVLEKLREYYRKYMH